MKTSGLSATKIDEGLSSENKLDYVLAPIGFMYNRRLRELSQGDLIESTLDETFGKVYDVAVVRIGAKSTDLLSYARYGVGINRKLSEWRRDAVYYGNDRNVVSPEECLLITYRKWKPEK